MKFSLLHKHAFIWTFGLKEENVSWLLDGQMMYTVYLCIWLVKFVPVCSWMGVC